MKRTTAGCHTRRMPLPPRTAGRGRPARRSERRALANRTIPAQTRVIGRADGPCKPGHRPHAASAAFGNDPDPRGAYRTCDGCADPRPPKSAPEPSPERVMTIPETPPPPNTWPRFDDTDVLRARGARRMLPLDRPNGYFLELEPAADGRLERVATILLTNRECPLRCTMCDLWKNTIPFRTPRGAIPQQIRFALNRLPPTRVVKLYNSGNFFDPLAIPPDDHPAILRLLKHCRRLIVENHPRFCGARCLAFAERLAGTLEVAIGLETAHPDVLARLNKRMTLHDFRRATELLRSHEIDVRAFVLLQPPFLFGETAVQWAVRTVRFAFDCGAVCCSIIPTRGGDGLMRKLQREGWFRPPTLAQLESVVARCVDRVPGRVFVDLWDIRNLLRPKPSPQCRTASATLPIGDGCPGCIACGPPRIARLRHWNLHQTLE
ncbi:MAG: radical SAM protein [Planctomycetota bacterium]|nr:MAG: radical SAM protein [Planctomycetota bacterium]